MTNTHTLSRRIVAALDPDGTRWPKYHRNDASDGSLMLCTNVPDLAQPANLHLLLEVADSVGHTDLIADWNGRGHTCFIGITKDAHKAEAPTRSLAVLAAVCAALGIEVEA